jgi:hypothetical protein
VAAISVDESTDLTGKANTLQRVRRVWRAHKGELLRGCSGSVGGGISRRHLGVARRCSAKAHRAKRRAVKRRLTKRCRAKIRKGQQRYAKSHVITVFLQSARDLPESKMFIEGVPIKFGVTGQFRIQPQVPEAED